jgi:hypothetical protein
MKKIIFIALGLLLLVSGLAAKDMEQIWTFDKEKTGILPQGFTNEKGDWKIMADPSAPSKPNALAQSAKNSGSTFNLILCRGVNLKNVELSVMMKAVAGQEDQGGGLVWRARDAGNYYIVRYNPLEDNYRLYKVEKGNRRELQSADIKHSEGWHTLRVTMEGDLIQCFYDGRKALEARDATFSGPGKIGLWTKADAQSYFDDLKVIGK